jgi:hypothetical protein
MISRLGHEACRSCRIRPHSIRYLARKQDSRYTELFMVGYTVFTQLSLEAIMCGCQNTPHRLAEMNGRWKGRQPQAKGPEILRSNILSHKQHLMRTVRPDTTALYTFACRKNACDLSHRQRRVCTSTDAYQHVRMLESGLSDTSNASSLQLHCTLRSPRSCCGAHHWAASCTN